MKPKVAYQGEAGAYGYVVAKRLGEPVSSATFHTALGMVASDRAQLAVIPVENSTYGGVADSDDAMYARREQVSITGEVYEPIRHCLIGDASTVEEVRQVYSHPQALGQCGGFIKKHHLQQMPHYDTAASVPLVKKRRDRSLAAIAGRGAASMYGMNVIAENINDDPDNVTRFLVLGQRPGERRAGAGYKTTIAFTLPHRHGALASILGLMEGVNLTRISSRPAKDWKYIFFVDFEGHTDDYRPMMEAIREACMLIHVFGSYPRLQ